MLFQKRSQVGRPETIEKLQNRAAEDSAQDLEYLMG